MYIVHEAAAKYSDIKREIACYIMEETISQTKKIAGRETPLALASTSL